MRKIICDASVILQDAKKGGAGVEDLPAIMSASIDTTLKHLSNLSIVTADKAHQLTSLTEKLLYTELGNQAASENDIEAIKYGLVNIRQFQVYLGLITKEVTDCSNRLVSYYSNSFIDLDNMHNSEWCECTPLLHLSFDILSYHEINVE